jgi:cytoskeletal protein CcmA (bactofilin family)
MLFNLIQFLINNNVGNWNFIFILFIILLIIPFIIPLYEIIRKKEQKLEVNLLYTKQPDYFGKEFLKLMDCSLNNYLKNYRNLESLNKIQNLYLELILCDKRKEKIFISDNFYNIYKILKPKNNLVDIIIINKKELNLNKGCYFFKEFIANDNLEISSKCEFNSLIVKGDLILNPNSSTKIHRYLHVEGDIFIEAPLDVELSIFCENNIYINSYVSFKRMFAKEILTKITNQFEYLDEKNYLDYKRNINIKGSIKIEGNLEIKDKNKYIIIDGNLISNGNIIIDGDVWIKGNVFSQENIEIYNGVIVGEKGKYKSIVARKKITLGPNIKVYGYIHSELISSYKA